MTTATDELADDYKASLQELSFNSRHEISNLTVIARENIHAAQAIARTLEQHISSTSPARKLPALYLLDSIAKNVGTPYTLFFQRNLYQTFMDAYLVVDPPIRRKLEEMLQTWKQPVPGSTSSQPCFSLEVTRKIDNALIKARTAALQYQQKQRQSQAALGLNRMPGRTNTPPQAMRNGLAPPPPGYPMGPQYDYGHGGPGGVMNGQPVAAVGVKNNRDPRSASHVGQGQPVMNGVVPPPHVPTPPPSMGGSVDTLQSDISRLIDSCRMDVNREPGNEEMKTRLQALLDLRDILQTTQLPEPQLAQVREQVRALSNRTPPPPVAPTPPPPPPPPPVQLPFSTQDLAALLATVPQALPVAPTPTPQPPPPLPFVLPQAPPPAPTPPTATPAPDPTSLFAALQSSGLLPGLGSIPPPPPPSQLPFPLPGNLPASLPGLSSLVVPQSNTPVQNNAGKKDWRSIDVELKSSSLKQPRPHLIPLLDQTLPKKCSSCARRFEDSEKGRKEKAAHLDWHFRVHQRMAESVKRGQNRTWYVGEEEWIRTTDDGEDIATAHATTSSNPPSAAAAAAAHAEEIRKQYVVVPDASETHRVCPICQEELKYVWHDETEEFVWMDAKDVGGRIFHASCHEEASRDRDTGDGSEGAGGVGNGMGKRKAEEETGGDPRRVKKEAR